MPKRPKPPLWQWLSELHWGIKTALPIFLLIGAMGSAAATWDKFGWWKPASVRYVDSKTESLRNIQIDIARGKRDAARDKIYQWQDKLDKTTDPEKRILYRDRVREFTDTKNALDDQINTLNRMRGY